MINTKQAAPRQRSQRPVDANQFNIQTTIPKQGSGLQLKFTKLPAAGEVDDGDKSSIKSHHTLVPTGRLQQDSKMTVHQPDDHSPSSPNRDQLLAAAANAPEPKPVPKDLKKREEALNKTNGGFEPWIKE